MLQSGQPLPQKTPKQKESFKAREIKEGGGEINIADQEEEIDFEKNQEVFYAHPSQREGVEREEQSNVYMTQVEDEDAQQIEKEEEVSREF